MKDQAFKLTILGIVGLVLLVGVTLLLYGGPVGKAVAPPPSEGMQLAQSTPPAGVKCERAGSCRTLQLCSTRSDGLFTDSMGMGCVDAAQADAQGIPYCGHMTRAQDNKPCNYQDKNPRCVCP